MENIVKTGTNIIKTELHSSFINIQDIKKYVSDNFKIISMEQDIFTEIKEARIGVELWRYFLYATILVLIIE